MEDNNNKIIKNIFLIIALAIVIIMVVGIMLYDYIPSGSTVREANIYETSDEVSDIISEINLTAISGDTDEYAESNNGVIVKSYTVTETDLALYSASGSYNSGKSDPFADVVEKVTVSESGESSSSSQNSTSTTTTKVDTKDDITGSTSSSTSESSDGTLFNSTKNK